jgi:putative hemolysin
VLGDLPSPGASVQVDGHTITVTELDGRRIARLRVAPRTAAASAANAPNAAAVPAARLDSSEKSQVEGG